MLSAGLLDQKGTRRTSHGKVRWATDRPDTTALCRSTHSSPWANGAAMGWLVGERRKNRKTFEGYQTDVWFDCLNLNGLIGQILQPDHESSIGARHGLDRSGCLSVDVSAWLAGWLSLGNHKSTPPGKSTSVQDRRMISTWRHPIPTDLERMSGKQCLELLAPRREFLS